MFQKIALIFIATFVFIVANTVAQEQESLADKYFKDTKKYFQEGDFENVFLYCKKILEIDPNYEMAYYVMGRAYILTNKPNDAIPMLEKALSINPNDSFCYVSLGEAYMRLGQYERGIVAVKKALLLTPENKKSSAAAYVTLACIYMKIGQFKESYGAFEKAKNINENFGDIYANLGTLYCYMNQPEKAKENYKKAIAIYNSQNLIALTKASEKQLNAVDKCHIAIYLTDQKTAYIGVLTEETDTCLKVKGDRYLKVAGGSTVLNGVEDKIDKSEIERIDLIR